MILLDTNVISALMQNVPDRHVVRWLDRQPVSDIWLPSVVVFELRYGLGIMPAGSRRERLEQGLNHLLNELAAKRKAQGTPVDLRDTLIAGIALASGALLATRNYRHFMDAGVSVVNPFNN